MTLFTDFTLDDRLQRALATAGFVTPTAIQAAALPVAMEGRDLVGTAQTGTGKTAAFVLPILHQLINLPRDTRKTRAVILAPTRELVEQILDVVRTLAVHTNLRAVAVYGGVAMHQQTHALRAGVEIVVACPGRLLDHIKRRNADLRQIECVVLDEADRMLDMGFMPNIQAILKQMPTARQTLLFSATFAESLNAFVDETLTSPERVAVDTAVPAQTVHHTLYQVAAATKPATLVALLQQLQSESDSVLIFTRTRATANHVVEHLRAADLRADVLHSEKSQAARQHTLDQYRNGVFPYLVATDIAARGIDVSSISHVINYDMPDSAESYLHRIGRTGRMERTGAAISLITRANIRIVREVEKMLGEKIAIGHLEGTGDAPQDAAKVSARTSPRKPAMQGKNRPVKSSPRHEARATVPTHAKRPKARHDATASPYARLVPQDEQTDASPVPMTRKERRLQQFGPPTGQPARLARAEQQHRDGDAAPATKPRGRAADRRPVRPERPNEAPSGPRPHARAAHARNAGASHTSRAKRPGDRRR